MTRPHLDALYRTAVRMTGRIHAAEDLVQDTCVKAYGSFATHSEASSYRAWLFRIMMNTHIDQVRRHTETMLLDIADRTRADRGNGELPEGEHSVPEVDEFVWAARLSADPEANVHKKAFVEQALLAIDRLAPEVRSVVILAVFEECEYEEIAHILGCPIGTVRSRLRRGRLLLQADLANFSPRTPNAAQNAVGRVGRSLRKGADE